MIFIENKGRAKPARKVVLGGFSQGTLADDVCLVSQTIIVDGTNTTAQVINFTGANTHTAGVTTKRITANGNAFIDTTRALVEKRTTAAINATATATAAEVATGYITSTSAAATQITLPTGTLLGAALGASQGTTHELYIDNTAGANTVTIAVAVNGILSAGAAAVAGTFGLLTVPSGVTGQARFTIMFSSATAYTFTRTA
jgi:hypothetical protein